MTAIVGLVHEGEVWIGGDSRGAGPGWDAVSVAAPKVFLNRGIAFGFTTSFRIGQLLQYAFRPPVHDPDIDHMAYLTGPFVNDLRQALKNGGFARVDNAVEEGGHFLVGYRGRLFHLQGDYSVLEARDGYDAVGCGADLCRGALFASTGAADERLRTALAAAARWSAGVAEPFTIVHTERPS